jgi:hypothetical protein
VQMKANGIYGLIIKSGQTIMDVGLCENWIGPKFDSQSQFPYIQWPQLEVLPIFRYQTENGLSQWDPQNWRRPPFQND